MTAGFTGTKHQRGWTNQSPIPGAKNPDRASSLTQVTKLWRWCMSPVRAAGIQKEPVCPSKLMFDSPERSHSLSRIVKPANRKRPKRPDLRVGNHVQGFSDALDTVFQWHCERNTYPLLFHQKLVYGTCPVESEVRWDWGAWSEHGS